MKRILILAAALSAVLSISSCAGKYAEGDRMTGMTDARIDSISYAVGMYMGEMIVSAPFGELDLAQLNQGFKAVISKNDNPRIKEEEVGMIIQKYLMDRNNYVSAKNQEEGEKFFLENKEKEGVVATESGLQYKILKEGSGIAPAREDTVVVNYEGRLLDGTVFDSSYERGETAEFSLSGVIKGWTEGLTYVKEGGAIELYIPAALAYGSRGTGPIPANSTLIFKVELIKVTKAVSK